MFKIQFQRQLIHDFLTSLSLDCKNCGGKWVLPMPTFAVICKILSILSFVFLWLWAVVKCCGNVKFNSHIWLSNISILFKCWNNKAVKLHNKTQLSTKKILFWHCHFTWCMDYWFSTHWEIQIILFLSDNSHYHCTIIGCNKDIIFPSEI